MPYTVKKRIGLGTLNWDTVAERVQAMSPCHAVNKATGLKVTPMRAKGLFEHGDDVYLAHYVR